jgi:hypothetical protein
MESGSRQEEAVGTISSNDCTEFEISFDSDRQIDYKHFKVLMIGLVEFHRGIAKFFFYKYRPPALCISKHPLANHPCFGTFIRDRKHSAYSNGSISSCGGSGIKTPFEEMQLICLSIDVLRC